MPKDNLNRTTRYLTSRSPAKGFDGYRPVPRGTFDDPSFLPRNSFLGYGPDPMDWSKYIKPWARRDNLLFVCDTGVFDNQTPDELWHEVTRLPGRLVLTPKVRNELKEWLERRPRHPMAAVLDPSSGLADLAEPIQWPEAEYRAYRHYLNILCFRKRGMALGMRAFERIEGRRATTDADMKQVAAKLQRDFGERGYAFAKKGATHTAPESDYADEEVVYIAAALALKTGRETVVLTKDLDLLDQFYRLMYLITTHYASMLLADDYAANFANFRRHPLPTSAGWSEVFAGSNNCLVELPDDYPEVLFPQQFEMVPIHCQVIGRNYNGMVYGADRALREVIITKGAYDGANSSRLLPRNCHLLLPNLRPEPGGYSGRAFVIAEDQYSTPFTTGQKIPMLEYGQGLANIERFRVFREGSG